MVTSRALPGLERKPGGPDNWVEEVGGLPEYIERIAKHLHYEKGMTISHAIATAVNTVKRWARKGGVVKYGDPNNMHVTTVTAAQAMKAVAEWEAKKAKARTSAGSGRSGTLARRATNLSESNLSLQALATRTGSIEDPVQRGRARRMIIDLALPAQQKCKYCDAPATKRILHSEGMAYIPTCDNHLDKGKKDAMACVPSGKPDPSNINSITDLSELIDLAMTKDGRKSFRNQGKWKHGFVPADSKAVEAKAKGSPIATRRINRLFGRPSGSQTKRTGPATKSAPMIKVKTDSGKKRSGSESVQDVGQSQRLVVKDARNSQRVTPANTEVSKGRRPTKRSDQSWDKIPESQKTVRGGKRYVLTTYNGQQSLTEWTGGEHDVVAPNVNDRVLKSITTNDANNLSTAAIRRLLKVKGQPEAVRRVLNAALADKVRRGVTA